MSSFDVVFVGAGAEPESQDGSGFAMAYRHGTAFDRLDSCRLLGVADIVPENARAFADYFDIEADGVFGSHTALLEEVDPDIVSVCTPPHTHADIVVDCAQSGVEAIHCEKPMAHTWEACRRMASVADEQSVQLTFNHQRRFGKPYRRAKELLDAGTIGDLERVELAAPNVYDYGSHSFDLCNYFNDEHTAEWVIGQVDYREENRWFGAHNENQALASWEYENGVTGLAATGTTGSGLVGCHNRLRGSRGVIEVGPGFPDEEAADRVLRVKRDDGDGWEYVDTADEGLHGYPTAEYGSAYIDRAVQEVVDAVAEERPTELSAENALRATELIFGIWHSARKRGRVDFPLAIDDNPLAEMVESGVLSPEPSTD